MSRTRVRPYAQGQGYNPVRGHIISLQFLSQVQKQILSNFNVADPDHIGPAVWSSLVLVYTQSSRQKGVFDDIFSYFSSKPYVVTPHLHCLAETVQMRVMMRQLRQMRVTTYVLSRINKNYPKLCPNIPSNTPSYLD